MTLPDPLARPVLCPRCGWVGVAGQLLLRRDDLVCPACACPDWAVMVSPPPERLQ